MSTIDLNKCFPEPFDSDLPRGPLPKQLIFLNKSLDPDGPKYIRYLGGIGSGKSLIGCITVLSWAIQYPGDYLIARQFMPELRDTTYKIFLDVCPKELIVEHRVADAIIRIRTAGGGVANIMFRGLEEPDKLRSLNLNAFYIDEANQVSEFAFELLQGRLRGRYVRKGIITQNSGGHDWTYRIFVKKDHLKATKKLTLQQVRDQYFNIVAPSTENIHLPDGFVESLMASWSENRINREILADEDSFEGQVYTEFRQDIHVISPFPIPSDWTKVIGADHGYRNPAAFLLGAVDPDGNLYITKEFYEREWLVPDICTGRKDYKTGRFEPGISQFYVKHLDGIWIDPSTKAMQGKKTSIWDDYRENIPSHIPLYSANRDRSIGIERVKQYLKLNPKTKKPRLFIFDTCTNLIDEMQSYRWAELPTGSRGKKNEKEEPQKVNDHACDALRYLIMSRPETELPEESWYDKNNIPYDSKEGRLHRELEEIHNPSSQSDPFGIST